MFTTVKEDGTEYEIHQDGTVYERRRHGGNTRHQLIKVRDDERRRAIIRRHLRRAQSRD